MWYLKNGEKFTLAQVRLANPNMSIPEGGSVAGYTLVTPQPRPDEVDGYEAKINDDGSWSQVPLTEETVIAAFEAEIQAYLDQKARARGYDGIVSACSYAGGPNPFQAESLAYLAWRGAVWAKCYEILDDVQHGNRPVPTVEDLITELPILGV